MNQHTQRISDDEQVVLYFLSRENEGEDHQHKIIVNFKKKFGFKSIIRINGALMRNRTNIGIERILVQIEKYNPKIFAVENIRDFYSEFGSEDELLLFLSVLSNKKIRFISIEDDVDKSASESELILLFIKTYRESAFNVRSANVRRGLQSAKEKGKMLGRPAKRDIQKVRALRDTGFTIQKIAETLNLSVGSVHRSLKDH